MTPRLVSEGGEMAGVLAFVAAGLGAAVVPAIALPGDGSLVGVPFSAPGLRRTVALAQRGDQGSGAAGPGAGRPVGGAACGGAGTVGAGGGWVGGGFWCGSGAGTPAGKRNRYV